MQETNLDIFKREMEPSKEIYTRELKDFAKRYDFLGEMSITEDPDIDTQDYIYTFKNLNGTSKEVINKSLNELNVHMKEFSKANGIWDFFKNAYIFCEEKNESH